jgi:DNA-binding NarL/FixJ family response regulator
MYSVLLVDDHVLFREGLRTIITRWEDFEVVAEAENGQQALEITRDLLPDVILMDIGMPVMDGLLATEKILREFPSMRVVILTVSENEDNLFHMLKLGAQGFLLKNTPARRLHDQLRGVMQGDAALSGRLAAKVLDEFNRPQVEVQVSLEAGFEPLSSREREVLQLVAEGLSNQEIGKRLFLSENTIKKYIRNILDKLQLNNRVQAAVYAVRKGLAD